MIQAKARTGIEGTAGHERLRRVWPFTELKPFLDYLRVECGLADNTLKAYSHDLLHYGGYCDENGIDSAGAVTPVSVQQYAQQLFHEKLASSTIARRLVAVRMFFRYHLLNRVLEKDPCAALETPKSWKRLPGVLSREKTVGLIEAFDESDSLYLRNRALLELLYATGMRASEAAGLKQEDINFSVGYVRCLGKGRKERIVPVHATALAVVKRYMTELRPRLVGERGEAALFVSRTGRGLSRVDLWRIVTGAARRAGMAGHITPHTLRHCFGSHLLQGGADLRVVQEMLGHADVTTTQIYTHVDQEHLRHVHKKYHPRG